MCNLTGLARVQPEALPVIAQLERGRLAAMEHLANRLHRTGRLRRDLTPAHAVDLLLISTAFAAWDELVTSPNRSPAAAITDLAVTAVVRGPEPGSTRAPGTDTSDPGSPLPPSPGNAQLELPRRIRSTHSRGKQLRPDIASQNPRSVSRRVSPAGCCVRPGKRVRDVAADCRRVRGEHAKRPVLLVGRAVFWGSGCDRSVSVMVVEVCGAVAQPGGCPVLVPGDVPAHLDGPECGDGDAGEDHRQGHDHEGGGVSG